jgi:hypothetical protein
MEEPTMTNINWTSAAATVLVIFALWKFFAIIGGIEAGAVPAIQPMPAGEIAGELIEDIGDLRR